MTEKESNLKKEIRGLRKENLLLRQKMGLLNPRGTVRVPKEIRKPFDLAEKLVGKYFSSLKFSPSSGSIEISNERYILIRASALSHEFLNTISDLYKDRGADEALHIGKNILFDLAHVLGMEDAKSFHKKMGLSDPVSKLSAGPVHFAYTGWAFVDILQESTPFPDDRYYLKYNHPYSFEADSWVKAGKKSTSTVCIMNSGYSSGWCEASFGIPLTAVEISCKARGDKKCTFIMAPPHKIDSYLKKEAKQAVLPDSEVPFFLQRKKIEEQLSASIQEKEVLIKEIHHRVKNNLQIISSLLNLQASNIDDVHTKEKFKESIGRVKSMAIIHELLYKSKNISKIHIQTYLKELTDYIGDSYNVGSHLKLRLNISVKKQFIDIEKAIPCGIIINELLSNALKYAIPVGKNLKLWVEFRELAGKKGYELIVGDDGVGLPESIEIEQSHTLGLQLVQALVSQLGGKSSINRNSGSIFTISFPF